MSVSLTGNDTIIIAARVFRDLADGNVGMIEFPNNLVEVKNGKNGNRIYALNAQGGIANLTLRLIRGSSDDKYLNSRLAEYRNDPASFILMDGEFVKRVGDGQGNVTSDVYRLDGGIIQKVPGVKDNVEGDTEQAVSIWNITFGNTNRAMS
jgi:hypothetical protein